MKLIHAFRYLCERVQNKKSWQRGDTETKIRQTRIFYTVGITVSAMHRHSSRCRWQRRGSICPCIQTCHVNVPANATQPTKLLRWMFCIWPESNSFTLINLLMGYFRQNAARWLQCSGRIKASSLYKDAATWNTFYFNTQTHVVTLCLATEETIKKRQSVIIDCADT